MSKAKEEFEKLNVHKISKHMVYIICTNRIGELKEYNDLLVELIDYCCYDEDFDADHIINKLKELKLDYE